MARSNSHSEPSSPPRVPAALLERHRDGWYNFTRFAFYGSLAVSAVLALMLIFLRLL